MDFQQQNAFEIRGKIKASRVAILPIGAVEAHGPHLPLGTDNILATALAKRLADRVNGFVLPTLPYGQVWSLQDFPGSLTLSNQTLTQLVVEIGESIYAQGFHLFVLLNGHYGNHTALKEAARTLFDQFPERKVFNLFYPGTKKVIQEIRESPAVHDSYFHACELETSYMLYLAEQQVNMEKAICDIPEIPLEADITPTRWSQFTKTAVLGDATVATKEKGAKVIGVTLDLMTKLIEQAKREMDVNIDNEDG